ncbi:PE-PPE domain-containing protein [Gordonia hankookensis]|uniref:PE-PPE domain-containing protein n=1 Tax=Gordonia hankookensis TaxID=589403 RepID=UPI001CBF51FB|nr:PE-PPE domain-containing protein [Gordonia hankookensis]
MRRVLLSLCVFLAVVGQVGSAHAMSIEPVPRPGVEVPASWPQAPQIRSKAAWLPTGLGDNATVILVPGTGDADGADQWRRTVDIGMYDTAAGEYDAGKVVIVSYPAAFGFDLLGIPIHLVGDATYNESVDVGTVGTVEAARAAYAANPDRMLVLNGYSQSGPIAWNAAYLLHKDGTIPDENMVVLLGADTRFPNTGVEVVVPSFIPGLYTNGARDESDTGGVTVISYCVRGDSACGLGNPLVHPFETAFYLLPGFYIHGADGDYVNQYTEVDRWTVGNTTYVVLDGGNPWGMLLRGLGVPVPTEFDTVLSALVRVPMPGEQSTVAGFAVPTPREIQEQIFAAVGVKLPVTDPDALEAQSSTAVTTQSRVERVAAVSGPESSSRSQERDVTAPGAPTGVTVAAASGSAPEADGSAADDPRASHSTSADSAREDPTSVGDVDDTSSPGDGSTNGPDAVSAEPQVATSTGGASESDEATSGPSRSSSLTASAE